MIYTTCLMCYATFSYSRSAIFRALLGMTLLALALAISLYYHYLKDPVFHQNAYGILTAVVLIKMMHLMERTLRPKPTKSPTGTSGTRTFLNANEHQVNDRESARNREILMKMWELFAYGLSVFLIGFLMWNLDNRFCVLLRRWRHQLGLPWGLLLEGHGWWHAGTAYGAFCFLCVSSSDSPKHS